MPKPRVQSAVLSKQTLRSEARKLPSLIRIIKSDRRVLSTYKKSVPSETIPFDGYFSTVHSFVTEDTPETEFARASPARPLGIGAVSFKTTSRDLAFGQDACEKKALTPTKLPVLVPL